MDDALEAALFDEIRGLEREGPRARHRAARLMLRGDWRTRTLALSAMGRIVRDDPSAWRRLSVLGRVLDRVPGLRKGLPTVGRRGRLVSRAIANGLAGRCFIVRTAAALALGECRDPAFARALESLLGDPFRPSRLVRSDMTALPFPDRTFDGAIVVDALHHVPDLAAALREARRVLAPGGRLVLAEPGEGHSETEKSRAEAREHGVREGEIHPFAVERLARAAGFDRVSIVPRLPLGPVFDAGHLRAAMRQPVERWQVEQPGGRSGFDTLGSPRPPGARARCAWASSWSPPTAACSPATSRGWRWPATSLPGGGPGCS